MLEYDRIDIPEGIDTNKTSTSKECNLCHYCCFKGNYYKIHFWYMSKNDAIVLMTNSNLNDKKGIF